MTGTFPRTTDPLVRIGALAGIGGSLLYAVVVAVTGYLTPGYDPLTQWISELGATGAPYANLFNVLGPGIFGLLSIVFAAGIWRALKGGPLAFAAAFLVAISGFAGILEGVFPCDPGCVPMTMGGSLHLTIGIVPLLGMLGAMEIFAFIVRKNPAWPWFFAFSQAMVILTFIFAIAFFSGAALDGLYQRIMIGSILVWVVVISAWMWKIQEVSSSPGSTDS
jgi:hypothetical membrane protein